MLHTNHSQQKIGPINHPHSNPQQLETLRMVKGARELECQTIIHSQVPTKKHYHWYSDILIDDESKNTLHETLGSPVQHPVSKTLVWKPEYALVKACSSKLQYFLVNQWIFFQFISPREQYLTSQLLNFYLSPLIILSLRITLFAVYCASID